METGAVVQIFAALSQETRLTVLRLLVAAGPNGLPAGAISGQLGLPASTASFHLAALERAGLLRSTRQGRHIRYAVHFAALRALLSFLTDTCCGGRPDLCGDLSRLLPLEESRAMTPAFNVLFLCTHNSARSLIAEAILRDIGGGRFNAYSAGSAPASAPMPDVIEKLRVLGHDTSKLHSKSWDLFVGPTAPRFDFVIALCDVLHGQTCPDFGPMALTASWPLPDPSKFSGSTVERSTLLNELYASLQRRLGIFISLPFTSLDQLAMKARLDEIGGGPVAAFAGRN